MASASDLGYGVRHDEVARWPKGTKFSVWWGGVYALHGISFVCDHWRISYDHSPSGGHGFTDEPLTPKLLNHMKLFTQ